MVTATKKAFDYQWNPLIACMKQAWLWRKRSKIQESIIDKQLYYFKSKDKLTNETQMNMVNVITSFINVMSMILKVDKGKEQLFPKQDFDDLQKENGQKKMYNKLLAYKIPNVDIQLQISKFPKLKANSLHTCDDHM